MYLEIAIARAWACPSIDDALERATVALVEGSAATGALADAEASLACAEATKDQVARLWLVRGADAWFAGRKDEAAPLLGRARGMSPSGWDARFGKGLQDAWQAAPDGAEGTLAVDRPARIDGGEIGTFPLSTPAGPHTVQVVRGGFGRVVFVQAGESLLVETGLPVELPPPPSAVAASPPPKTAKSPALLIASIGAGVAAGGLATLAYLQNEPLATATGEALDNAHTTQAVAGYSAYGLGGLALTGLVLHFVLP